MKKEFEIGDEKDVGKRLDNFLKENFSDFSRSFLQHQVKKEKVSVNYKKTDSDYRLKFKDIITLDFDITAPKICKSDIPVDIIYEDEYILAVNKPSGMVTHPACGNYSDTLVNVLMTRYGVNETSLSTVSSFMFGIVHRLDKETSGIILVAKNEISKNLLQLQFKNREIKKEYRAIVDGIIKESTGHIDYPLKRDTNNRLKMKTDIYGKAALTNFEVIDRFKENSYLKIFPETGRTHQIRTHFAYIGHPVSGDVTYGSKLNEASGIKRTMLHAYSISFIHPGTKKNMKLISKFPDDFEKVLSLLKKK